MHNNNQTIRQDERLPQAFDEFLEKFESLGTPVIMKNGYQLVSFLNPNAPEFTSKNNPTKVFHNTSNEIIKEAIHNDKSDIKEDLQQTSEVMSTTNFNMKEDKKVYNDNFPKESLTIEITEKNIEIVTKPTKFVGDEQIKCNKTKVDKKPNKTKKALVENVLTPTLHAPNKSLRQTSASAKPTSKSEVKSPKTMETQKFKTPNAITRTLSNNGLKSFCANILRPMRTCESKTADKNMIKPQQSNGNQAHKFKVAELQHKTKNLNANKEDTHTPNSRFISKKVLKPISK